MSKNPTNRKTGRAGRMRRRAIDKIKFSIGAKLITIVSLLVIFSLGSITVLVSWLIHEDLRVSAEDNNLEVNRRSGLEAESAITNIRSNSRVFIQTLTSLGGLPGDSDITQETADFFFTENPHIAAVYFINPASPQAGSGSPNNTRSENLFVNEKFFSSRELESSMADSFFKEQRGAMARAIRGETLLNNAAPFLSRSCLVLFFPFQFKGSGNGVGAVLFSSESLNNNFGFGVNQSFMINRDGDLLAASDFNVLRNGKNLAGEEFIMSIIESAQRSRQQLLEVDLNFLQDQASVEKPEYPFFAWEEAEKMRIRLKNVWEDDKNVIPDFISRLTGKDAKPQDNKDKDDNSGNRHFIAYTKLNIAQAIVITSIEYDKVFEGIAATTRRNIFLTIAVLAISVIFIWFFSKTISVPLKTLAQAARQIEGGIFDLELSSNSNDEVGILTNGFQKMCAALNVFGRFTNKDIAVKAMRGEIKPGGLPKHGTIFFSDIREFTAKSEQFTTVFGSGASDKIVAWLNAYFTQMVDCVEKTNGVVDKFIGDAVMAHWGTAYSAGSPRKDAFNCVKAALMMRKALYFLNKSREENDPGNPYIKIGCGINTGIVTAGQLGSEQRMEYTVIGDPVNLASRIEALTKPLGADILISEDTWKLVGDKFITEEMPSVTVKGKEKPVRIFAVVNFKGEPKGPQSLSEVRELLGIKPPEMDKVDVNADEKKYKIGGNENDRDKNDQSEPAELIDID